MLWYCLWAAILPLAVLGQTYYINFVFNNDHYATDRESVQVSKETESQDSESQDSKSDFSSEEGKTIEVISEEKHHHQSMPEHPENIHTTTTKLPKKTKAPKEEQDCGDIPSNTDEQCVESLETRPPDDTEEVKTTTPIEITTILTKPTAPITTTATTSSTGTSTTMESITQSKESIEKTTVNWLSSIPHPPEFFDYPQAKCHEEINLHELFGIPLSKDRGLPSKVLCEFDNSWGGPWLLMNRMELPTRIHMRHWFFGYITEDYKDMNINFLALAHIINNMRLAMLIIGQDNNNQLVYNLYDDFVLSGFNDLFMLRKAHLVEANTTDLMFISIGEVLVSDSGRNRSCPFRVLGAWWGPKWNEHHGGFCVFPVERDINRPGYVAFFIKPNPFEVNNTAFYNTAITTRRPWVSTINPILMDKAKNERRVYYNLKETEFLTNKKKVREELNRREDQYKSLEARRRKEEKNGLDVQILTIDQSMDKT